MWDAAFGNDGFVTTNFDRLQTFSDITDLIVQPDGKLLSAVRSCQDAHGYTSGCGMLVLARTNSEGAIDTPFGTNGVISTPLSFYLPASAVSAGQHVALQPNGMIVVGGSIQGKPALVQPAENKRQVQPRRFARKVAECNLSVNFRKLY